MGVTELVGEILTLVMIALALGMDAFSLGLGMGMIKLRLKQIFYIGITIGLFHFIMPLLGIWIGRFISFHFSGIATYIGGALLLLLGIQMVISSFSTGSAQDRLITPIGFGLFLFALSVSLDSFSVGLSLGIFGARVLLAIFLFGFFSMILAWAGLILGRKVQHWLGSYGEALGGSILFACGLKLLLPI
ncbi:manganese efflux pump MntP [Calidifontibacillus oryziterrae]|uniref:manganese efflux pump MntP n=1 Tax=Calidifontibacillus oryziterrae TaxID=1191699 RepID=UPI0002E99EF1|nr:manganese efflux pump MntP family protein [Calidifontibacillus oryziterrae]